MARLSASFMRSMMAASVSCSSLPCLDLAMSYPDIDNLDHDEQLAIALGNMVVVWARAETVLVQIYAHVAQVHYNLAAAAYYRIPTFESRVQEQEEPVAQRDEIHDAVSKLSKLAGTRNRWVHGLWGIEEGTGKTFVWHMREPAKGRTGKHVKAHDVNDHVGAVRRRTQDLEKFVPVKIGLYTSPKKSR